MYNSQISYNFCIYMALKSSPLIHNIITIIKIKKVSLNGQPNHLPPRPLFPAAPPLITLAPLPLLVAPPRPLPAPPFPLELRRTTTSVWWMDWSIIDSSNRPEFL